MFFAWCCCSNDRVGVVDQLPKRHPVQTQLAPCVSYDRSGQNVTYIGDVDGNWDQFCSFVDHSRGLSFVLEKEHHSRCLAADMELRLEEDWHFVFGGDALDKGPGTLRVLDTMVMAKKKWPTRVHLLFGNRDINKMGWARALAELDRGSIKSISNLWREDESCNRHVDGEFECRRQELARLEGKSPDEVTQEDVVDSYADSLKVGGYVAEFVLRAQLAILLGDNLFADGQVIALDSVPGMEEDEETVRQWIEDLNEWGRGQAVSLMLNPAWDAPPPLPEQPMAGGKLLTSTVLASNQYSIFLSKSATCAKLGLDTEATMTDQYLTITKVHSTGLVALWNSRNPKDQVLPGDQLISANGVSGLSNSFHIVIANSKHLTLILQRG